MMERRPQICYIGFLINIYHLPKNATSEFVDPTRNIISILNSIPQVAQMWNMSSSNKCYFTFSWFNQMMWGDHNHNEYIFLDMSLICHTFSSLHIKCAFLSMSPCQLKTAEFWVSKNRMWIFLGGKCSITSILWINIHKSIVVYLLRKHTPSRHAPSILCATFWACMQ